MAEQMKQPVLHNEELESQMKVFHDAQTKENMVKVFQLLDKSMVMQPALLPANVTPQMMQQMAKSGNGAIDPKMRPQPVVFKNNNGDNFLPIFTSKQQIPEGQKYPAMLFVPFKECAKIAARPEAKINGIVVNPFTDNLVLHQAAFQGAAQNADPVAAAVRKVEELSGKQKQAICCNQFVEEMAKRFFKRIAALFVTAVMVCSICLPVSAAGYSTVNSKASSVKIAATGGGDFILKKNTATPTH